MKKNLLKNCLALCLISCSFSAVAGVEFASGGGMYGSLTTFDSTNRVRSVMTRNLLTSGYWTVKTWQCNTSAQSGCTQFNTSGLVHLNYAGQKTIEKVGTPGKWYYTSVYNQAGTRLLHTASIRLN